MNEKERDIEKTITQFQKNNKLSENPNVRIGTIADNKNLWKTKRLPTGVHGIDILTGGGLVAGKTNEIYGPEGVCKTTLTLKTIATNQTSDPEFTATYINNEKTFDSDWALYNGVNPEKTHVADLTTSEDAADMCNSLTGTKMDMIVFDTIQALSTKAELGKGDKVRSVADKTMGDLPRMYSQFFRMYNSYSTGAVTLLLLSQVRMDLGSFIPTLIATGGNAIKHASVLTIELTKAGKAEWPTEDIPPKSFPIRAKIKKAKLMNRYEGNSIILYFYKGTFDRKFNVVAIGKQLELHDGRSLEYTVGDEKKEFKAKGFNDFVNRIPEEAVTYLEGKLLDAYTAKVMLDMNLNQSTTEETNE